MTFVYQLLANALKWKKKYANDENSNLRFQTEWNVWLDCDSWKLHALYILKHSDNPALSSNNKSERRKRKALLTLCKRLAPEAGERVSERDAVLIETLERALNQTYRTECINRPRQH